MRGEDIEKGSIDYPLRDLSPQRSREMGAGDGEGWGLLR